MKKTRLFLSLFLSLALTAFAAPKLADHVVIVSIDQGAPEGIQRAEMPVLKKMAAEGAHTWKAQTILPSATLQSHVSMLTGVGIEKHKVTWNDNAPGRTQVEVPTLFSLAKARGLSTVLVVGKDKVFSTLTLPGSLDFAEWVKSNLSIETAKVAAEQIVRLKPNVCFVHLSEPDPVGHRFGMHSPQKMKAYADADAAIQILRDAVKAAGIEANTVFIITADHGCHDKPVINKKGEPTGKVVATHGSDKPEDMTIPWIAWGKNVKPGHAIDSPVTTYDTTATALWVLGIDLPENFDGKPVKEAFKASKK